MKELKIGVIGTGGRGGLADHAHKPDGGVILCAGADPYQPSRQKFRNKYPQAQVYDNYKELLVKADIEAVFICSPDFCHEEQALAALDAGLAVYLEKPMAITIEGCDRILHKMESTGGKLFLGHNMRHFESVLTMKKIIDEGTIGKIQAVWCRHFVSYGGDAYFKDWHSQREYSNGLLLQKGAHDIDVIHWLAGGYAETVTAMGKLSVYDKCERRSEEEKGNASFQKKNWPPLTQNKMSPHINVEDHNMVLMQLDNGVQVSYTQCHYTPDAWRNYTFIGTKGRIENRGDSGRCQVEVYTNRSDSFSAPDRIYKLEGELSGHGGADPQIVQRFVDYVREGVVPNTSPLAARNAVAAGVMATESIRDGSKPKYVKPYVSL